MLRRVEKCHAFCVCYLNSWPKLKNVIIRRQKIGIFVSRLPLCYEKAVASKLKRYPCSLVIAPLSRRERWMKRTKKLIIKLHSECAIKTRGILFQFWSDKILFLRCDYLLIACNPLRIKEPSASLESCKLCVFYGRAIRFEYTQPSPDIILPRH